MRTLAHWRTGALGNNNGKGRTANGAVNQSAAISCESPATKSESCDTQLFFGAFRPQQPPPPTSLNGPFRRQVITIGSNKHKQPRERERMNTERVRAHES